MSEINFAQKNSTDVVAPICSWAHDIRGPLAAMKIYLKSREEALPADAAAFFNQCLERLQRLSFEVLNTSSPMRPLNEVPVDRSEPLAEIIDRLLSEQWLRASDNPSGLSLEVRLGRDVSKLRSSMPTADLERALGNIISNAVEALPNRQGQVCITLGGYKQNILLMIEDSGSGFTDAQLKALNSGGSLTTTKSSGRGWGLKDACRRLTNNQASVQFERKAAPFSGSRVKITLPVARVS